MKKVLIKVLRTHPKKGNQFWQSFEYDGDKNVPISAVLNELNSREKMIDTNLDIGTPILWDCNCEGDLCGSCAMVINHVPRLACTTMLSDVLVNGEVEIRPLTKFPIIADLRVDRTIIIEGLNDMKIWLKETEAAAEDGLESQSTVSKCLACGCCLEVCPNYSGSDDFAGAMAANLAYSAYAEDSEAADTKGLKKKYKKKFFNGCSKSLMCVNICPMGIPAESTGSAMTGMSIWRIWQKK